jgi:hypothetical protein
MPFTIPNEATAAFPEQAYLYSSELDILSAGSEGTGVVSGCAVTAQGTPNATLAVAAGVVRSRGTQLTVAGGNTPTISTGHATLSRLDLVVITAAGAIAVREGTAAATPVLPTRTAGDVALAMVRVAALDSTFESNTITPLSVPVFSASGFEIPVAASDSAAAAKAQAAYVCDGTDDHVEIQAAIDAFGTLGGVVRLAPGNYTIGASIELKSRTGLEGPNWRSARLVAKTNLNAPVVKTHRSTDAGATDPNAQWCSLRKVYIDGNKTNQAPPATTVSTQLNQGGLSLVVTDGSAFPAGVQWLVLGRANSNLEIAYVTSRSGNTFTLGARGRIGTGDYTHAVGVTVSLYCPAVFHAVDPLWSEPAADDDFDTHFVMDNCYITDSEDDGFAAEGRAVHYLLNGEIDKAGLRGMSPSADTWVVNWNIGLSSREGAVVQNAMRYINVACFYSGNDHPTLGAGFRIRGAGPKSLVACKAQDNKGNGFWFNGSSQTSLMGCLADSNGVQWNGTGTSPYAGYVFDGTCTANVLEGCQALERKDSAGSVSPQRYAVRLDGTANGNRINLMHGALDNGYGLGTVENPIHPSSTSVQGNDVRINGMFSTRALGTVTTTQTLDPYAYSTVLMTLGANITLANPTYAHIDQSLQVVITQDGTGGRIITWGSAFVVNWVPNTEESRTTTIEFVYDGTNWVQTNSPPSLIYSQRAVAGGDTVANTVTTTNLASSKVIPANTLKAGRTIRLRAGGVYGTHSTGTLTLTFRVRLGSTELIGTPNSITLAASQTNRGWWMEFQLVVITVGASGTIECQGMCTFGTSSATVVQTLDLPNTAVRTVDTTADQTLQIAVTHGAANANNTITKRMMTVEVMDQ